jgi:hypothetical protein
VELYLHSPIRLHVVVQRKLYRFLYLYIYLITLSYGRLSDVCFHGAGIRKRIIFSVKVNGGSSLPPASVPRICEMQDSAPLSSVNFN